MKLYTGIKLIPQGQPSARNDYPYLLIYCIRRNLGERFKFRQVSIVKEWNADVDMNNIDRAKKFVNMQDKSDPFMIFAKSSKRI